MGQGRGAALSPGHSGQISGQPGSDLAAARRGPGTKRGGEQSRPSDKQAGQISSVCTLPICPSTTCQGIGHPLRNHDRFSPGDRRPAGTGQARGIANRQLQAQHSTSSPARGGHATRKGQAVSILVARGRRPVVVPRPAEAMLSTDRERIACYAVRLDLSLLSAFRQSHRFQKALLLKGSLRGVCRWEACQGKTCGRRGKGTLQWFRAQVNRYTR
jgi:hypothetical protein